MESSTIRFDALLCPTAVFAPAMPPNDKPEGYPKTWAQSFLNPTAGSDSFQLLCFTKVDEGWAELSWAELASSLSYCSSPLGPSRIDLYLPNETSLDAVRKRNLRLDMESSGRERYYNAYCERWNIGPPSCRIPRRSIKTYLLARISSSRLSAAPHGT